ncbi:uncharacterized protein TRUGW13939_09791 [Talaromyces rugulosus]|uniref:Uncharacterized protein n=1 Tax=Talaromyces rugulosus TaxID=121627 RepID=A0A7H8R8B1_TALRU|nr:uncharacterized protein TRUGW13939_09791 [Talaromyces rugulosus]QKX62630.1 hypothetical protein TRUGW13939_09791 [Talaromyces rugulosus]
MRGVSRVKTINFLKAEQGIVSGARLAVLKGQLTAKFIPKEKKHGNAQRRMFASFTAITDGQLQDVALLGTKAVGDDEDGYCWDFNSSR